MIIESAPVSIVLADADGRILAANRSAMALLGAGRLDQVLGQTLETHLAPPDRARFRAFVEEVCRGKAGTLEYALVKPDGARCAVETHAVPLAREGVAPAAFLGATWDVTDRERLNAALRQMHEQADAVRAQHIAERTGLEQALGESRAECDRLSARIKAEQQTIGDTLRETRNRMRAALIDAEAEHAEAANQWRLEREALVAEHGALAAEREALVGEAEALRIKVGQLEHREAALSAELTAERETSRIRLEEAERGHQREREQFRQDIRELEDELARTAEAQLAIQEEIERIREAERTRVEQAIDQRRQWQGKLAGLLGSLQAVSARVERLVDDCGNVEEIRTESDAHAPADPEAATTCGEALPFREIRLQEYSVQLTPVHETSVLETPGQEASLADVSAREKPAGDTITGESPVDPKTPTETVGRETPPQDTHGEMQWGF